MPCELCNDQGFVIVKNVDGFDEYAICTCHKSVIDKRKNLLRYTEANIPKHFWSYELDWYKEEFKKQVPSTDKNHIINFIENPELFSNIRRNLWIFSDKEKTYKTSLAIQLGKSLLNKNIKVAFVQFRKLMELFLDFENKKSILKNYLTYNYIIIDDMFNLKRASVKEYQAVNLYGFMEDAINNNVLFICTSTSSLKEFFNDKYFSESSSLLECESIEINLKGN